MRLIKSHAYLNISNRTFPVMPTIIICVEYQTILFIHPLIAILSTTIYLWLISLTASKELSILLLKLYNDGAIGISNTFLDSASVIKTDNQLLIRSVRFMQVESP